LLSDGAPASRTGLFGALFARGGAATAVSDRAWLAAMLDVEAALARACAKHGLCPTEAADAIADATADVTVFDIEGIGHEAAQSGTPVVSLVRALRVAVGEEYAPYVHLGATSQDIVDTATMLVVRRALEPIMADAGLAADACARLAVEHRETVMVGRTLLQPALPTTFGLRAAGWMVGLDETRVSLRRVRGNKLALQLGGGVGTLAAFGDRGLVVAADMADELELPEPTLPWHTIRNRPAALAGSLGAMSGVLSKIAFDVVLLSQGEVGELREGGGAGRGASSAMPQKRNPVSAVMATACGRRVPGLVAGLLGAMAQELDRAAGAWQSEAATVSELLRVVGAQVAWVRELVENLDVDVARMRANVEAAGDLLLAESVVTSLARHVGLVRARGLVDGAVARVKEGDVTLGEALHSNAEVVEALGPDGIDAALSPDGYLGATAELIDRALVAHREAGF
jgi:3-carboxy-cis,cis-muconate cycloisomerase